MTMSFYLICFGVLGCYAALRTIRAPWAKGVIAILMVGCLIHLGIRAFLPASPAPATPAVATRLAAPPQATAAQARAAPQGNFFHRKLEAIEADKCVLDHLKESPLSPLVYMVELHRFLTGYKQLQAAQLKGNMTAVNNLFGDTFGDSGSRLSPEEQRAVQSNEPGNLETLCGAFGKWTETLAQKSQPEQKRIWDSFQASIEHTQ
jgi:hypothetical protein